VSRGPVREPFGAAVLSGRDVDVTRMSCSSEAIGKGRAPAQASNGVAPSKAQLGSKPAGRLRPGDVIELSEGLAEVLGEPFLGQNGASPFDEPRLFWRVWVKPLGDADPSCYVTWEFDALVRLAERRDARR
jgi:hypothetical protein